MDRIKVLLKCGVYGVVWTGIIAIIALIIARFTTFTFEDTFFTSGIILIIIGFFSSMGGESVGAVNYLGQGIGASFSNYANLELKRRESKRLGDNIKKNISFGVSGLSLIIGGLLTMFIGYLI